MASILSPPPSMLLDAATIQSTLLDNYCHLFASTILFFDHLITLDVEITFIWKKPKTVSACLFIVHRYQPFISNIIVTVLEISPWLLSLKGCTQYHLFRQIQMIITQMQICGLLTLRVYAIYDCSKRVLTLMCITGLVLAIVTARLALVGQHNNPIDQSTGCHVDLSRETADRLVIIWESLLCYDTLVIVMTLLKAYHKHREHLISHVPLLRLIFRDGIIFFIVMALANLANILTFYFTDPFFRGGLSTFASCISVTVMSRLMLNLYEEASRQGGANHTTDTNTRVSIFAVTDQPHNHRRGVEEDESELSDTGDLELEDLSEHSNAYNEVQNYL